MIRIVALVLLLCIATAAAPSEQSSQTAAADAQVRQATSLLFTTFYRKLDPRSVLDAEHRALLRYGSVPPVPAAVPLAAASDAAVAQFDGAAAHARVPATTLVAAALKAMTGAAHDRYTTFFTAHEYRDFDEVLDPAKLSGIGVLLDVDPQSKFVRAFFVVPETPADRAGLRSGDLITSIDNISTRGWNVPEARRHMLGKTGTKIALTFEHPNDTSSSAVTIVREQVQPPTVYFSMLPQHVAYIYVAAFGDATPREFHNAVERSEAAGARAYVMDLRNDGGGIVGTALSIASTFIDSGHIVSIESNAGHIDTFDADNTAISPKPLAVLVNGYSASASEITAAAIAESGTGVLVGTKTFGKGVVQSVTKFPDGSAIKITTGRYYTPLNHDINGRGITPSIVVQENPKAVFGVPEKDAQLRKALEVIDTRLSQNPGIDHT